MIFFTFAEIRVLLTWLNVSLEHACYALVTRAIPNLESETSCLRVVYYLNGATKTYFGTLSIICRVEKTHDLSMIFLLENVVVNQFDSYTKLLAYKSELRSRILN